ncbi:hypothetical protein KKE68_08155 [Patescibacteria group bacterium]|nr:hypothetical protein [Patescibacteria group bacterium]
MDDIKKLPLKERFIKIYANLPSQTREEIIYITEDKEKKPFTWNAVYIEVINNTPLSEAVFSSLERLGII